MATAREELEEITGEEQSPTVREAVAEIGRDPAKYDKIFDAVPKDDPEMGWEDVYRAKSALEAGALTLLTAAYKSGEKPDDYLTRLAPYFDSKIDYDPRLLNVEGFVSGDRPNTAVISRSARELGDIANTVPHELEHTLQNRQQDNPAFTDMVTNPIYGSMGKRFSSEDMQRRGLRKRLDALPEEQKNSITDTHPVFGRYLGNGEELMARIQARAMTDAAQGKDFLNTEMGQSLFPDDDARAYFVASTLPGTPSASPPYAFERTDSTPTSVEDKQKSYARRMFEMLPSAK